MINEQRALRVRGSWWGAFGLSAMIFGGCNLLFERLSKEPCQQVNPRCEGDVSILCIEESELRVDCSISCDEGNGVCISCGDGLLSPGEECDDDNDIDTDDCAQCRIPVCGDGFIQDGIEQCDDGALNSDTEPDACRIFCALPVCGDLIVDSGEACDLGPFNALDSCNDDCTTDLCRNGILDPGEECEALKLTCGDPADTLCSPLGDECEPLGGICLAINIDGCDPNCTFTRCGNGFRTFLEQCDDGNNASGDGCDSNCFTENCGNGAVEPGEECDDNNIFSGDGCNPGCLLPLCGDGVAELAFGEECDDGNNTNGDDCASNCTLPDCGDSSLDALEQCDDGNTTNGDGCDNNCSVTSCRNGIRTAGELCYTPTRLSAAPVFQGTSATVALVDFNQDGLTDILWERLDGGAHQLQVHFGRPNGGFAASIFLGQFGLFAFEDLGPFAVLTLDEGFPDVVFVEIGTEIAGVFSFSEGESPLFSTLSLGFVATSLLTADIDNDGDDDLVATSFISGSDVFLQDDADALVVQTNNNVQRHLSAIKDINEDGVVDLIGAQDGLFWQPGNGDGTFQNEIIISNALCNDVSASDVNDDGDLDLICAARTAELLVFLGDGAGGFTALPPLAILPGILDGPLRAADLDQDGALDLFASKANLLLLGNGDGTFRDVQPIDTFTNFDNFPPGMFLCVDSADLDGDGLLELVSLGDDSDAAVWVYFQRP
jgi:cysteine-rich repeat protein